MPPRIAPNRGGPQRGGNTPRGGRGGGAGRGSRPGGIPSAAVHADTVKVHFKRPNFGTAGRPIQIIVNSFAATIPQNDIFHYDVVIEPGTLPPRVNLEIFTKLQDAEPNIFTPKVVYDGRKNVFAPRELPLGETNSQKFSIGSVAEQGSGSSERRPRVYHIKLTKVAQINTEILQRFVDGKQLHDEKVLTAIMALNVVIRMEPNLKYTFDKRSFYTPEDKMDIGNGLELWRGIFQSVRPAIGRLVVNIDLTTGVMFKGGPLIELCLDFFGQPKDANPVMLSPPRGDRRGMPDFQRVNLQKFLAGIRVEVETTGSKQRVIRALSKVGAEDLTFSTREGETMTVAQYFRGLGRPLRHPSLLCVQVGTSAMIPLELCKVPTGQIMRKTLPENKIQSRLEFSTMKPPQRLDRIKAGIRNLQYGRSDYVQQFGMDISAEPMTIEMRVIDPPKLRYGGGSKQPNPVIRDGAWNMVDKKFFSPASLPRWVVIIYESNSPRGFPQASIQDLTKSFLAACADVGIEVQNKEPIVKYENGQGNISAQLKAAGKECIDKFQGPPSLVLVVLPDSANDIWTAVKHFGEIEVGVPTQCLKAQKCKRAKQQYWMNVMLKVNVKLGGINTIPEPTSLIDPRNPTIILGADVIHPAPGTVDRPSFTALVGSVDSNAAKYVATDRVQTGRQEIIDDLKDMCKGILTLNAQYRSKFDHGGKAPTPLKRLIFFRDGVSEGQFQHVLDLELPKIKEACQEFGINPQITLIVVGKRHHNQMFPSTPRLADRSGNCPAGSVIDREIVHPTDFDFILQSHGGLLGTSRPAHYSVLYDDFGFNADSLQALSYALCHVYAPATRSVSIPAPVYYADKVCSRSKTHFSPSSGMNFSETATHVSGASSTAYMETYKREFKPLHVGQRTAMYFC